MLVEELLELLVGKVDTELLKTIHCKVLKTENIQYTDECKLVLSSLDSRINPLQDPAEEVGIDTHGGRVTGVSGLRTVMIA